MKAKKISLPIIIVSVVAFMMIATGIASWIITITKDFTPNYSAAGEVVTGLDLTSPTYDGMVYLPKIIDEDKVSTSKFSIGYVRGDSDNYKESDFTTISFDNNGNPVSGPKDAGTYTILYKNKSDGSMVQVKFTINKAELLDTDIVLPTLSPIFYGNTPTFLSPGSVTHELATKNANGENNVETVNGTFIVSSTPTYVGTASTSSSPITIKFVIDDEGNDEGNYLDKELITTVTMYPVACIGSNFYGTVVDAINAANAAGSGEIFVLLNDKGISGDIIGKTINSKITISSGVTLTIPHGMTVTNDVYTFNITLDKTKENSSNLMEFGELYHASKTNFADSVANHTFLKNYIVISNGVSITISSGATLKVTGIIGSTGQGLQGHTSGDYAEIKMMPSSSIINNGLIICGGYIKEVDSNLNYTNYVDYSGNFPVVSQSTFPYQAKITVNGGGEIRMPFVVHDYRGGTSTAGTYVNGSATGAMDGQVDGYVTPFSRYNMPNIQTRIIINYGGILTGYADLYTGEFKMSIFGQSIGTDAQHNVTSIAIIGPSNSLITVNSGTRVTCDTVVRNPGITSNDATSCRTILALNGPEGASLNYMSLTVSVFFTITITTKGIFLPISYFYDIILESGIYDVSTHVKLLPGASLTVKKGATLDLNSEFIVYSDFVDTAPIGYHYPNSEKLGEKGAHLYVNGILNINSSASFGGTIKANGETGVIYVNTQKLTVSSNEGQGKRDGLDLLFVPNANSPITESLNAHIYQNGIIPKDPTNLTSGTYYSIKGDDNKYGWYSEQATIYFDANGGTLTGPSSLGPYDTPHDIEVISDTSFIPTREYYTFYGWYSDKNFTKPVFEYDPIDKVYTLHTTTLYTNITLYAKWVPTEYPINVKYVYKNCSESGTITNTNLSTFNILTDKGLTTPTHDGGYVFGGWFADEELTIKVSNIIGIDNVSKGSIDLYGLWYPQGTQTYTVSYITIGNDDEEFIFEPMPIAIFNNTINFSYPANCSKYNSETTYKKYFDGWYIDTNDDGEYDTLFDPETHLNKDITIYCVWKDKIRILLSNFDDVYLGDYNLYVSPNSDFSVEVLDDFNLKTDEIMVWFVTSSKNTSPFIVSGEIYNLSNYSSYIEDNVLMVYGSIYCKVTISVSNSSTTTSATTTSTTIISGDKKSIINLSTIPSTCYIEKDKTITFTATSTIASDWDYTRITINDVKVENSSSKTASKIETVNSSKSFNVVSASKEKTNICVTPDTLITLADGSQVRIDSLTGNEKLLVWNHELGKFESVPIGFVVKHDIYEKEYLVNKMIFSDNVELNVLGEHVFYNVTLNKYVQIGKHNYLDYINHEFLVLDGQNFKKIQLLAVEFRTEYTRAYSIIPDKHLVTFNNGILSAQPYFAVYLNAFDIDRDTLQYINIEDDINKYGLFTPEDVSNLLSEREFEIFGVKYYKIAISKGYTTWEELVYLFELYREHEGELIFPTN